MAARLEGGIRATNTGIMPRASSLAQAASSLSDLTDRREKSGFRDKLIDLMRRIARYLTNQSE
ncbi:MULTISPECIES: hypothetical protein [Halomonadaceae]|uniref:hypothetical protein n=1 Tax=Halomonadaceae TaxID=28256 RepID=UPI0012371E47|nr:MULTISPECIES: hypothetical protein [Halomonas]MCD6009310.1 hypothetical protein [Halomonas sp. IOP_31]